jgi:GNAT superfamily N-acetyltransferase
MHAAGIRIEPLAPARCGDYLAFFDHERGPAFADNPRWSTCYCHYHEVAPAIDWETLDGPANRKAMRARIETAEMEGFLAYDGANVVGWLNAQPRHKLPHAFARMGVSPPPIDVPDQAAALIVCFVVAHTHRRRGVARALLHGALAHLAARGIALVDAFPYAATAAREGDAPHYHGPLALYESAGFTPIGTDADRVVVRKVLAPSPG